MWEAIKLGPISVGMLRRCCEFLTTKALSNFSNISTNFYQILL